jgi:anti-sigma B factor antagonist
MDIEERLVGDIVVVTMSGDVLVNGSGARLANRVRRLLDRGRRHIVLDLAGVARIDSGGLGSLVEAIVAVKHRGGSIGLMGVPARLGVVLAMTRVLASLDCGHGIDDDDEVVCDAHVVVH